VGPDTAVGPDTNAWAVRLDRRPETIERGMIDEATDKAHR
jgi:hypothetical protein